MEQLWHSCKPKLIKSAGISFAIFLSVPYIFDIATDIKLAYRYFDEGERYWGSLTTVFITLQYFVLNLVAFCVPLGLTNIAPRFEKLVPVFALFGILPVVMKIFNKLNDFDERSKQKLRQVQHHILLIELFCEALPQCCLQVYIVGHERAFDFLLIVSIFASLLSIAMHFSNGVILYWVLGEGIRPRYTTTVWREIMFSLIVVPYCFVSFVYYVFSPFVFIGYGPSFLWIAVIALFLFALLVTLPFFYEIFRVRIAKCFQTCSGSFSRRVISSVSFLCFAMLGVVLFTIPFSVFVLLFVIARLYNGDSASTVNNRNMTAYEIECPSAYGRPINERRYCRDSIITSYNGFMVISALLLVSIIMFICLTFWTTIEVKLFPLSEIARNEGDQTNEMIEPNSVDHQPPMHSSIENVSPSHYLPPSVFFQKYLWNKVCCCRCGCRIERWGEKVFVCDYQFSCDCQALHELAEREAGMDHETESDKDKEHPSEKCNLQQDSAV